MAATATVESLSQIAPDAMPAMANISVLCRSAPPRRMDRYAAASKAIQASPCAKNPARAAGEATLKTATGRAATPPVSTSAAVIRPKYLCNVGPVLTKTAGMSMSARPDASEWQANIQGMRCCTTYSS
jgi:hypothetical protein